MTRKLQFRTEMKECNASEFVMDLLEDAECFPVQKDSLNNEKYFYENGYGGERTYGGNRKHEGIDILTSNNRPGYFSVCSVSDGTVEKIGWLKLGGYRIGIRSDNGMYYYYAHLDSYADGIAEGKRVKAGEVIAKMGDTGYGTEGTHGKFPVHLHFGIYYNQDGKEKSLNPYYLLKYLDE